MWQTVVILNMETFQMLIPFQITVIVRDFPVMLDVMSPCSLYVDSIYFGQYVPFDMLT